MPATQSELSASRGKGNYGRSLTDDGVGSQTDQFFCECPHLVRITGAPANFDPELAAFCPPQLRDGTPESVDLRLRGRSSRIAHQHADQPHAIQLLRVRRAAMSLPRRRGA